MPINYPSNPTLNQTYVYSGKTWTWNGSSWIPTVASSNADTLDTFDSTYFLNASNLSSGTLPAARLSGTYNITVGSTNDFYSPSAGVLASVGSLGVIIDSDNNSTNATFSVRINANTIGSSTSVFSVDEAGNTIVTGVLTANGNPTATNEVGNRAYNDARYALLSGATFTGATQFNATPLISHTAPSLQFTETDQGTGGKIWDFNAQAGVFTIRTLDDAFTNPVNAIAITRSGTTITNINFTATNVQVAGNGIWHAGNFNPANYAALASPALSGTPTAPTATGGTNTTQIATTAFVNTAISGLSLSSLSQVTASQADLLPYTTGANTWTTTTITSFARSLIDDADAGGARTTLQLGNISTLNLNSSFAWTNTHSFTSQITSSLATGTAPFSIASTTAVTNLNADLLDGQHGSYYTNIANQTGVLPAAQGGTGLSGFTALSYTRAATTSALEMRTPEQVRTDIIATKTTESATPPANPIEGDRWLDETTGIELIYIDTAWVQINGAMELSGGSYPVFISATQPSATSKYLWIQSLPSGQYTFWVNE